MPGGVRLSGGPVLSETEQSLWESEVSSVISIGERIILSDTEDELADKHKYRLPDTGKTRLHLLTKEPLSPTARQVPRSPTSNQNTRDRPSTPRSTRNSSSPTNAGSPRRHGWQPNLGMETEGTASDSDFVGSGLSRAGSIYSLSKVSFAGQLSQLTDIRLPDATSLAKRISSIPTSTEAARTLSDASEQIRRWISKASEVLQGLDADDDVEWAAAGGREGIEDVNQAINRFEKLVDVYVLSIERLQTRSDVGLLTSAELTGSVKQMEAIIISWQRIRQTLKGVRDQVEIAMEWEELWNAVLGDIGQEMEALNRLVFEMEEKRYQGAAGLFGLRESIDLNELETIVEEQPSGRGKRASTILGVPGPFSPHSPIQPADAEDENREDSSLLGLFARMQPLRASLDFLPIRLSNFHTRGNGLFPTAYLDLENRRDQLEGQWKKLESDAESLRRELSEDRWIMVFRNAGRQALKMCESVERSYSKLSTAINAGEQHNNAVALATKVESFEAKKVHYGPAIGRVLAIIDRGVHERLTVNGEILRLQSDMKRRWSELQREMKEMESLVGEVREKQLRDSVSTVMSSERSVVSSLFDTPGSSPASSVVGHSRESSFHGSRTPTPLISAKVVPLVSTPSSITRSASRLPSSSSSIPRRTALSRTRASDIRSSPSPVPAYDAPLQWPSRQQLVNDDHRPKWINSTRTDKRDFEPLSKYEPSPYAKTPITPKTRTPSRLANRTPANRIVSAPVKTPGSASSNFSERKSSLPVPATPSARAVSAMGGRRPPSKLSQPSVVQKPSSTSVLAQPQTADGNEADIDNRGGSSLRRPPSSLENASRRNSMLAARGRSRLGERAAGTDNVARPAWRP